MTDTTARRITTTCPHCARPVDGNVSAHCTDTRTGKTRVCGWVLCRTCKNHVDLVRSRCGCTAGTCRTGKRAAQ